jgi:tetratricopeptide (TPR) repeat protein
MLSLAAQRLADGAADRRLAMGKALRRLALELDGEAQAQALLRAADELRASVAAGAPTGQHYLELGLVEQSLGRLPDAIDCYTQGLKLAPADVTLCIQRGSAHAAMGNNDPSRADFAEAIRLAPDNAEAHAGLGFVMAQAGDAADANRQALAAMLSGSNDYLILHNVACIYGRLSDTAAQDKTQHEDLAIAVLRRAVRLAREHPAGPDEIALIHAEKGTFPESLRARSEFKKLLVQPAPEGAHARSPAAAGK